jgi:hypothetical protein
MNERADNELLRVRKVMVETPDPQYPNRLKDNDEPTSNKSSAECDVIPIEPAKPHCALPTILQPSTSRSIDLTDIVLPMCMNLRIETELPNREMLLKLTQLPSNELSNIEISFRKSPLVITLNTLPV